MAEIYVIGSGPAGIAAAAALAEKGQKCRLIDVGYALEPAQQVIVEKLRLLPKSEWYDPILEKFKGNWQVSAKGVELKLTYGSDFVYRVPDEATWRVAAEGVGLRPSFARGGLSNAWGAAVLPYSDHDMSAWPIGLADLEPYYRNLHHIMPVMADAESCAGSRPIPGPVLAPLPFCPQMDRFVADLGQHANRLRAVGFSWSRARLALGPAPGAAESGCIKCGLCFYGCPLNLIYNSTHTLSRLIASGMVEYLPGRQVTGFQEEGDEVVITAHNLETRAKESWRGRKAYLGTGPIASAALMLESLGAYDRPVTIRDSQVMFLPFLRFAAEPSFRENTFSLAQLFMELNDAKISNRGMHFQFYSYNDLFEKAYTDMSRKFGGVWGWGRDIVLSRLLLSLGYLHSEDSSSVEVTLKKEGPGSRLHLRPVVNPKTREIIAGVTKKFSRQARLFRGIPLTPAMKVGVPGASYHCGGSFPMAEKPREFEADALGRVGGLRHVHLIDSSIFPDLPAAPITYTIMANAQRIVHGSLGWSAPS